jgi:hypothetical protein
MFENKVLQRVLDLREKLWQNGEIYIMRSIIKFKLVM